MKDYYSLFAELSLQQCTKEDYADKTKVMAGNAAHKKLKQLQDEMKQIDSTEVLLALLSHEDDRVKLNAASFCLQTDILVRQSVSVLKKIIKKSDDPTIAFSAKTVLQGFGKI